MLRELVAGLVHGPAELLPVSSSAHTALLIGDRMPPARRKAFEVALHAGSLPGLLRVAPRPRPWFAVLSVAPAALAGLVAEGPIERRLGMPRSLAVGLVTGSAILVLADRAGGARDTHQATPADALALGVAQAAALVPGLSRSAMTIAAARLRGFRPDAALSLSREAAVPVLVAATALKAARLARGGLAHDARVSFLVGTGAATTSGWLAAPRLAGVSDLRPAIAYRLLLAAATVFGCPRRSVDHPSCPDGTGHDGRRPRDAPATP